jgi:hypothetical protein
MKFKNERKNMNDIEAVDLNNILSFKNNLVFISLLTEFNLEEKKQKSH